MGVEVLRIVADFHIIIYNNKYNNFAQSNLGIGPRRGTVAHIRRKVPIGYNGVPQIAPKVPFLRTDPQIPLPASSLDPSNLRCQTASGSDLPFFQNALDRMAYAQTAAPTDRSSTGSLITIGHCAPRATQPKNSVLFSM